MGLLNHNGSSRKRKRSESQDESETLFVDNAMDGKPDLKIKKNKRQKKISALEGESEELGQENSQPSSSKKRKVIKEEIAAEAEMRDDQDLIVDSTPKQKKSKGVKDSTPKEKKSKKVQDSSVEDSTPKKENKNKRVQGSIEEDSTPKKAKKSKKVQGSIVEDSTPQREKKSKTVRTEEGPKKSVKIEPAEQNSENQKENNKEKKSGVKDGSEKEDVKQPAGKLNRTEKLITQVLNYLHQWKNDATTWKFDKYLQSSLIDNLHNPSVINEEDFQTSLEYIKKSRGNAKERLKFKAKTVIEEENPGIKGTSNDGADEEGKKQKKKKAKSAGEQDPEKEKRDKSVLFVKNLPYGQTMEEIKTGLRSIFTTATGIRMPFKKNIKYVGFAFVEFKTRSEVKAAISEKQGVKLCGRPLYLDRVGGDKNEASIRRRAESQSFSHEYLHQERLRRANKVLQTFA